MCQSIILVVLKPSQFLCSLRLELQNTDSLIEIPRQPTIYYNRVLKKIHKIIWNSTHSFLFFSIFQVNLIRYAQAKDGNCIYFLRFVERIAQCSCDVQFPSSFACIWSFDRVHICNRTVYVEGRMWCANKNNRCFLPAKIQTYQLLPSIKTGENANARKMHRIRRQHTSKQ